MTTLPNTGRVPEFTLGDRLRKARELTGYDRQQFAAVIGVHRESVAKYETGRQTPRQPVLAAWSLATGVDLTWLRNGQTPGPESGPGGSSTVEPPPGFDPGTYSLLGRRFVERRASLSLTSIHGTLTGRAA